MIIFEGSDKRKPFNDKIKRIYTWFNKIVKNQKDEWQYERQSITMGQEIQMAVVYCYQYAPFCPEHYNV